jgi:2-phosphoglycolate phosphatase
LSKIKNIIFDLDGTLIDSSEGIVAAIEYSLEQMNVPPQDKEMLKSYIGYPLSKMYPEITDASPKELYRHFQVKAAETVVASTVALPGADRTLRSLHEQGYRMAIATTKVARHCIGIIEKLGWANYFDCWTGGDEVERVKPFPDILHLSLERLGCGKSDTIVVGDTINDLESARAAGLPLIGVRSPYQGYERLRDAAPDHWIETLDEIIPLLNNGHRE